MSKFKISKFGCGCGCGRDQHRCHAVNAQPTRTQIGSVTLLNGASRIPAGVRSANTTMTNYGYRASNMQPSPTGLIRTGTVVVGANPASAAYRIGPQAMYQLRTQPIKIRR